MRTITLLCHFDFNKPGGAAYARMLKYIAALQAVGYQVNIFSSRYDYSKACSVKVFEEGSSLYLGNLLSTNPMLEEFKVLKYHNFLNQVTSILPSSEIIWLYNQISLSSVLNCLAKKWFRSKVVIIEKNELQYAIAKNLAPNAQGFFRSAVYQPFKLVKLLSNGLTDILSAKFSGIVVISTTLEEYYKRSNTIRVPILVDDHWFEEAEQGDQEHTKIFKIGYFGAISEEKDGVFSLIQTVNELAESYNVQCDLYGEANKNVRLRLKPFLEGGAVRYCGSLPSNEVFNKLKAYNLLALIRPLNMQTHYGFSTKLGEYLASATPVLATEVSDNGYYLDDMESAYLISAASSINRQQLKEKLREILNNRPELNRELGSRGRVIAQKHFRYSIHAPRLRQFIENLMDRNLRP